MKRFRITSIVFQFTVFLTLVMFLYWDSTPELGPDGRTTCELYEFPFCYNERYHSISLFQSLSDSTSTLKLETFSQRPLIDHAPILYAIPREPIKLLQWLVERVPSIKEALPGRIQSRVFSGKVMVVSVTMDEWKRLQAARKMKDSPLAYYLHE